MMKLNWRKALATVLAAATAFTSVPGTVFAGELTAADDNAIVLEQSANEEADAAVIEPVSEEISVEAAEDTIDVNTTVIDEQEEDIFAQGDTPVAADWHSPVKYTVGKPASGMVYDRNNNTPEGRKAGLYYDKRFYTFTTQEDGIYAFNATAPDNKIEFYLTPDIDRCLNWTNGKKYVFGTANPDLNKELYLLKNMTLFIVVDGYCGDDMDKSYEFTLSVKKKVKVYDKENPDIISLDNAKTTTGTIVRNFDGKNLIFNENENLSAHYNYYQFEVAKAGRLNMEFSAEENVSYIILNAPHWGSLESGVKVEWNPGTNGSEVKNYKGYADLKKGTYNLMIYSTSSSDGSSNYTLKTEFKPIKTDKKNEEVICDEVLGGSRNDLENAKIIDTNKNYYAQSSEDTRTKTDWYQINLSSPTKLFLSIGSTEIDSMHFYMRDGVSDIRSMTFDGISTSITKTNPIVSKQLIAPKYMGYTDTFPKGTYYIEIQKWTTGSYHFQISTGSGVLVNSIKLDKKSVTLPLNGTDTVTATVGPKNAGNKDVIWEVVDNPVAVELTDNGDGTCTLKGLKAGYAKIKAISSNPDKTAICDVEVLNQEVTQNIKTDAKAIVALEKIDLSENDYFGSFGIQFQNTDKFEVLPKNAGKVSNQGVFSAGKYSGVVTVTKKVKVGKALLPSDKVSFEIEQPTVKYKRDAKDKEIKFFTAEYAGEIFDATDKIESKACLPTTWEISDKQGKNFELEMVSDKPTGRIICKNNGTCKVSAVYGEGKNASRVTFTLKTVMPKLNAVKKTKQQSGQTFNLNLSNVAADETEIAWSFLPSESKELITIVPDVEFLDVNAAKPSLLKKKVVINNAVSGKIIATVKGHDYVCDLEVVKPEITAKNGKMTIKQGKNGKVAIKNTKLKGYTWVSEDPETVKIVDETKGTIEGVKEGVTRVYTDVAGFRIYCEVTVTAK